MLLVINDETPIVQVNFVAHIKKDHNNVLFSEAVNQCYLLRRVKK